jgi:hypothetical protein
MIRINTWRRRRQSGASSVNWRAALAALVDELLEAGDGGAAHVVELDHLDVRQRR